AYMAWDRSKGRPEPIRALNVIAELDNDEPLVSLLDFAPSIVIKRPSVIPFLRKQVVEKLERAALSLAPRYQLGVVDAWRPFDRQVKIWNWMWKSLEKAHPELSYAAKRRMVCRFVAPVDQKAPPGHTTGAAVDVWLLDAEGNEVDVTTPFERLAGAPTYVYGLSPEAEKNRMILVEAMLAVGFSNCRDEWWHYSFGDAGWAVRTGQPACIYGRVDLNPDLYKDQDEEWNIRMLSRVNPFLEAGAPGQGRPKPNR
ncbi:MAG: M15 family metallopeptidase, partial [Fimbriimonadaceae bacterium]